MSSTTRQAGAPVEIGGVAYGLRYSMLSLEKIERQFGSIGAMRTALTDERGEVRLDQPVIGALIDVLHAGLLDDFPDTPEARRELAGGIDPRDMQRMVEALAAAMAEAFGDLPGKVPTNRAGRRARSPGPSGTTSQRSSSAVAKTNGKP